MMRLVLLCLLLFLCGCDEQIVHQLSEHEANQLLSKLHEVEIPAAKERLPDGSWALSVSRSNGARALQYLSNARLLGRTARREQKPTPLVSSREQQRFQMERALSGEIEVTLSSLEGMLDARVHLHLPARDPILGRLEEPGEQGSASVLLVTSPSFSESEAAIAKLVAHAAGVKSTAVSVLISNSDFFEEKAKPEMKRKDKTVPALFSVEWSGWPFVVGGLTGLGILSILLAAFLRRSRLSRSMRFQP